MRKATTLIYSFASTILTLYFLKHNFRFSMANNLSLNLEFTGGAEFLVDNIREHKV